MKILSLKLVTLLEYQNRKTFVLNDIFQIGLKKLKMLCHKRMLLVILKVKKLLECCTKKIAKNNKVQNSKSSNSKCNKEKQ